MARVIKHQDETEFYTICESCKNKIAFYKSEVKIQLVEYSVTKHNNKLRYIICPSCNNTILFL
jgi:uncharacterized protein with PIN domain